MRSSKHEFKNLWEELDIPDDIKTYYKTMDKKELAKFASRTSKVLSKAKDKNNPNLKPLLSEWLKDYKVIHENYMKIGGRESSQEFKELLPYTIAGTGLGLLLGYSLDLARYRDAFGKIGNAIFGAVVRTIVGESDGIAEYIKARKHGKDCKVEGCIEHYSKGKLYTLPITWAVDALSHLFNFTIPKGAVYSQLDQVGATTNSMREYVKKDGKKGISKYFHNPVQLSSLGIVGFSFILDSYLWFSGFKPQTFFTEGVETLFSLLCLVPPSIGYFWNKRMEKSLKNLINEYMKKFEKI